MRTGQHGTEPDQQPAAHSGPERHPTPREYVRIAILLAVVTAAEVAIVYTDLAHSIVIPMLFFFAAVKFSMVVLWFMHLKFDSKTYARFFMTGIALALTLFMVVLISFRVFAR
jgi:cytochrome c oxidase subunit 4